MFSTALPSLPCCKESGNFRVFPLDEHEWQYCHGAPGRPVHRVVSVTMGVCIDRETTECMYLDVCTCSQYFLAVLGSGLNVVADSSEQSYQFNPHAGSSSKVWAKGIPCDMR